MMKAALVIVALALPLPAAAQAPVASAFAPVSGLQCDARTVTGATLSFELLQIGAGSAKPAIIAFGNPSGALIKDEQGLVFIQQRSGSREDEYTTGPNLVRIERDGNIRDLTFWSTRDDKPFQPVAYGYCVKAKLAAPALTADAPEAVFDRSKAAEGCHMTTAQPQPWRGPFTAASDMTADRKLETIFGGLPDGVGAVTLSREVLGNAPKAEHGDVTMMVGRFFNAKAGTAPAGMDVFYLDKTNRRATMLVKFDDLDGKGKQAFGICAFDVAKVEKP